MSWWNLFCVQELCERQEVQNITLARRSIWPQLIHNLPAKTALLTLTPFAGWGLFGLSVPKHRHQTSGALGLCPGESTQPSAAEAAAAVTRDLALPPCWTETRWGHCTVPSSQQGLVGGPGRAGVPSTSATPQGSVCPSAPRVFLFCACGSARGAAPPRAHPPCTDTPGTGIPGRQLGKLIQIKSA